MSKKQVNNECLVIDDLMKILKVGQSPVVREHRALT